MLIVGLKTLLIGQHVAIKISERDRVLPCSDRGNKGVIINTQASKDVGDEFRIVNGLANSGQEVGKALSFLEIDGDRLSTFLQI